MEYWTIYDKNRQATDRIIERDGNFKEGEYHMAIHVCIINSDNKMLIQQRQPFKEDWSNMWDFSVGGSALAGETSQEAAERELLEELGYSVDLSNTRPFFTLNFSVGFDDYYIIEDDIDLKTLQLQYEEVQDVRWASKEDIFSMIDEGVLIPYYRSVIEMIFEMRNGRGAHAKVKG